MKKLMLFSTLILTLTRSLTALADDWAEFDLVRLKEVVKKNDVRQLDELLPLLPQKMKQNPLLLYKSHALKTYLVGTNTPRMIFFNRDASLIFAVSRNPGERSIIKGEDSVEIISFNKQNGQFEFFDEVFDGTRKAFSEPMAKNPQTCLKCHGENPRPIFQDYNGWPGFYGSFGTTGASVSGTSEISGLRNFIAHQPKMPRYRDLDLSGFYKTSTGMAYKSQGFSKLHDDIKFTPNMAFGVEIESLMHKRLAKKLSLRPDFREIFPLFYYLGDEAEKFGVVESRCGHPNNRIKLAFENLVTSEAHKKDSDLLIAEFKRQTLEDYEKKEAALMLSNKPSRSVDIRGLVNIPFLDLAIGQSPFNPIDTDSFKKQFVLIESIFRSLDLNASDLSTTPDAPTSGIYHLSRLGLHPVDEQYFQNLIRGFKWAAPEMMQQQSLKSCTEVESEGINALVRAIRLANPHQPGILFR